MSERPAQQDAYAEWGREDVLPYLPHEVSSVLEVGCGRGGFGRSLRRELGEDAELVAIEAVARQAAVAREAGNFDRVHVGYFPEDLPDGEGPFDLICFNDVLEHLVDPWAALGACHTRLTRTGSVLAAIPNIQYGPAVWGLLRGRWEYEDTGILDRTHLRFFTRASAIDLFRTSGYVVTTCAPANSVFDEPRGRRWAWLGPAGRDFRWLHYIVHARPAADGEDPWSTEPAETPLPGRQRYRPPRPAGIARRSARRVRRAIRR